VRHHDPIVIGARLGPFEILGPIGRGGMGEVYRARDPRLDRVVAIKIVTASRGTGPAQIERFLREARAIGRLSHPHICTLHDVGQQDDVPFLVMELLDGPTLAERIAISSRAT
jgi:serine/threonine protein kinase